MDNTMSTEVIKSLLDQKPAMNADLENRFTYHAPFGTQVERYHILRNKAKSLAYRIESFCPNSREKSLALSNLEQAVMWANAAIARNEKESKDDGKI